MTEAANTIAGHSGGARFGFRWFGPHDVPIMMVAQTGASDIVSALHHIPNGNEWSVAEILKRKIEVEFRRKVEEPQNLQGSERDDFYKDQYRTLIKIGKRTGLVWSVLESLPFTEEIKNGSPQRDEHIANYQKSLDNLGVVNRILQEPELADRNPQAFAIKSVMGNFMLVADWTRTGYVTLQEGSKALEYNHTHFSAFDIFLAKRHQTADGAPDFDAYKKDGSYSAEEIKAAQKYWNEELKNDRAKQESIANMIIAGLPGAQASFAPNAPLETKLEVFREAVLKYEGMSVADLRENIDYFLKRVVPHAKNAGVELCCHPDDPAYSPFLGTPRAVGDVEGYKFLLDRGCGVGLCFGSLTPNEKNRDVMSVVKELAEYGLSKGKTIEEIFPHVHLRPVETNGKNFQEGRHIDHVDELFKIVYALADYGWKGVFRPDHAPDPSVLHDMMTSATGDEKALGNRGYSVPGRAIGGNLLTGLFNAAHGEITRQRDIVSGLVEAGMVKESDREQAFHIAREKAFESVRSGKSRIVISPALDTGGSSFQLAYS